jgi:hypothetical protein
VKALAAGADDDQHPCKTYRNRQPSFGVQPLAQPPGRQQGDQNWHGKLNGPGLGQLQILQGPEVQAGHGRQHQAP